MLNMQRVKFIVFQQLVFNIEILNIKYNFNIFFYREGFSGFTCAWVPYIGRDFPIICNVRVGNTRRSRHSVLREGLSIEGWHIEVTQYDSVLVSYVRGEYRDDIANGLINFRGCIA